MFSTEADARMMIDQLLKESGWDIHNKAQVSTEETALDGRADYLLKNSRTQPLAVVEAKRFAIDPYSAKAQAKAYAQALSAPFVILSNGQDHYFWDYADGDARPILGIPTQADLERRANLKIHRQGSLEDSLKSIPIPKKFRFKGEDVQTRPYQAACLQKADAALIAGRRRMLFEMATGTGKTLTIAMLMKRWFQAAVISRVLRRETIIVGPEGLAMDRKDYRDQWTAKVIELQRTDPTVRKIFAGEDLTEEEWETLGRKLDSPEFYFTEKNLRRAFEQPTGSLSDFIRAALGVYRFPTREERIEKVFHTRVAEHSDGLHPEQARMLRLLEARVRAGDKIEMRLFSQPPFSLWGGRARMEKLFGGRDGLAKIVDELNTLLAA